MSDADNFYKEETVEELKTRNHLLLLDIQSLHGQLLGYEHVKKCLRISQDKVEAIQKQYDDLQRRYNDLIYEKADNRRSIQKEIIADLKREASWLFEE